ncbi:MAG TPA: PPOX class F420-dependent oxidoreductase [Streptosporangiaceae bacterium]|jgi:pyridoxamine 5'-phosphate oxidase family protein|nr:PPOX class F420-dependent oxidoreductase [Streptosporangiaceae bacterium]
MANGPDRKDGPMVFTQGELAYLRSQRLGRLATVAPDGTLQNNPVGFSVDEHIASVNPWVVRCLEVRGTAEALTGQTPSSPYMSPEVIRIHPKRIISWGMGPDGSEGSRRTIT